MATNEEVLRAVTDMAIDVTDIKVDVGKINQRCDDRQKALDEHHESLYGSNGTKGLAGRVQSIEDARAAEDKQAEKTGGSMRRILEKVVAWGIIGLIVWVLMVYKGG